jgi:hypothetical protein
LAKLPAAAAPGNQVSLYTQQHMETGITLLEFSVVATVFAVLAGSFLSALLYYQEMAEKVAVEATIINMRTGLRWQIADKLLGGRQSELGDLTQTNPIRWLDRQPFGYIGERVNVSARDLAPGNWAYDPIKREIAYRPRLNSHLSVAEEDILRWRLRARRIPATGAAEGIEIERVNNYKWF